MHLTMHALTGPRSLEVEEHLTAIPQIDGDSGPVVCAVADDELAKGVVTVAGNLANRLGVALQLVHSVDPSVFFVGESRWRAMQRGHELLDEVASEYPHGRFLAAGDPVRLVNAVAGEGVTLIVIGTRGLGAFHAALLGSVSQAVARTAPCPVVLVSPESASARHSGLHAERRLAAGSI